jgi:hypothetical protein
MGELPLEAGKFVYVVDVEEVSYRPPFLPRGNEVSMVNGRISPNGQFVATWMWFSGDNHETIVFNNQGELIYSGATTQVNIGNVYWLGNEQVLTFARTRPAYFRIDPFRHEYIYLEAPSYGRVDPNVAFLRSLNSLYFLTYDGRYLYDLYKPIYDLVLDEPVTRENFRWGVAASNSHQLISIERDETDDEGEDSVYVYDFDMDTITQILTLMPGRYTISVNSSWSPDQALVASTHTYTYDVEPFDFHRVELLQLNTSEIVSTCLGLYFELLELDGKTFASRTNITRPDFAWSRDSRYLAMQGVLEGEDMEESFGVYIYDTQTDDIYLVHHGRADIIGWMASPDQEAGAGG